MCDGPLPCDVGKRADDRQRPCFDNPFPAAHEIDQDPGREQRETATMFPIDAERASNGSPVTAAKPRMGAPSAPKETGALFANAATRIASRSAIPKSHKNGHHDCPGITKPDEPFEESPEGPCQHDRLDSNVGRCMMDHPAFEARKFSGENQGIENNQAPKRDPINDPERRSGPRKNKISGCLPRGMPDQTPNSSVMIPARMDASHAVIEERRAGRAAR